MDGVDKMGDGDVVGCLEIGDGPGDFNTFEMGPGGEAVIISQLEKLIFDFGFERRKLFNFAGAHIGVANQLGSGEAF